MGTHVASSSTAQQGTHVASFHAPLTLVCHPPLLAHPKTSFGASGRTLVGNLALNSLPRAEPRRPRPQWSTLICALVAMR